MCLRPTPIVVPRPLPAPPVRPVPPVRPLPPQPIFGPKPPAPFPLPPIAGPRPPAARPDPPVEPRPVGPNPDDYPAGYPSKKPWRCPETQSDCSKNELAHLTAEVNRLCNKPDGEAEYPAPSKIWSLWWSCDAIEDLTHKWERCAEARRNRENRCFRGGDKGHRLQIAQAEYQVSYGYYLLRYWNCPGYGAPEPPLLA